MRKEKYTMRVENAKSCPFCNSTSVTVFHKQCALIGRNGFDEKKIAMECYCRCNKCHARSPMVSYIGYRNLFDYKDKDHIYDYKYKEQAIEKWNTRAEESK